MKNKSVKLLFVTKNCKHLAGTSGDNVSVSKKNISPYLHATRTKQSLPVPIVNVRTLSNQNSPVSSKIFPNKLEAMMHDV